MGFNLMAVFLAKSPPPKTRRRGERAIIHESDAQRAFGTGQEKKTNVWFYWAVFLTDGRGNM